MRKLPIALAVLVRFAVAADFRPPAVPLIAHDPYFSVWSMTDRLTDDVTRHWTGTPQPIEGLVRIDGSTYRAIGNEPRQAPALKQTHLDVLPTRTIYSFEGAGVRLTLTFLTPALPGDLEVLSRPATYVVWEAQSADGRPHSVSVYLDVSAELAVNTPEQQVAWARFKVGDMNVLRLGTTRQPVLEKSGDNLRIDWGHLYLVAPGGTSVAADRQETRAAFLTDGRLPDADDLESRRPARRRMPALAAVLDLGAAGPSPVSRYFVLAYDDLYSIEYFERRLRPYWRRNGAGAADLLRDAVRDYASLAEKCRAFDDTVMAALRRAGGEKYALLAALAYRQTLAAHKLVADADGTMMMFPKENFSNGCIGTVDVIYPASPFFLAFNPKLLQAQLEPVLQYASMPRWRFPFAPHDLGTYPLADGQVYGGGEKTEENQMPVEESGNMLILMAALARAEGNADFSRKYWPLLEKWAGYLKDKGLDPENQLSTDDFAGHLAHNANLSIKAILALRSYALLAGLTGHAKDAAAYEKTAREFAARWVRLAADDDHYRLAFDKPGTWSQKYNLVWEKLLGFHLFPPEVARKEIAFYKTKQNAFGLPLDNRQPYTKLDWILWTATLADSQANFEALLAPAYRFADESPSRVPLSDWYWTQNGRQRGFQARPVVGGIFVKLLAQEEKLLGERKQALIVADEFPAMEVLASKLKAAGVDSRIVAQKDLPPDLRPYSAVIVYIHRNIDAATERACIDYANGGGKLVLLHHSISSAKRANRQWLPFLGVSLPEGDAEQGGYKWIDPVTMEIVNLAPENPIASHIPNFTLTGTEVYLNHVLTGPHTLLLGLRYTDPKSGKVWAQNTAGWYRRAGAGWVFYFMPGHSVQEFENPAYARILVNAVKADMAAEAAGS